MKILDKFKEVLIYNETTGVFTWRVTTSSRALAGSAAGCVSSSDGYIYIQYAGDKVQAHRLAWYFIHGYDSEFEIDHRDRVRTNNAPDNLREASRQCQSRNCGMLSNNTSGIKGVSWYKQTNRWQVHIKVNGKQIRLAYVKNLLDAAYLRYAAEQCLGFADCDTMSSAKAYIDSHKY